MRNVIVNMFTLEKKRLNEILKLFYKYLKDEYG